MLFFCLYNLLMMAAALMAAPVWMVMGIVAEKRRPVFFSRLLMARIHRPATGVSPIWIHALSVGEVLSAEPLVLALSKQHGAENLIFTASTRTGVETASRVIAPHVAAVRYFPYDTVFSVLRALSVIRPRQVIVVETDIWPNFLMLLHRRKTPVCLVNARLSDRSFRGYRRIRFLMKPVLSIFYRICVQTEADRRRFMSLGVSAEKLAVPGNLKFDQPEISLIPEKADQLRAQCGILHASVVWVAGSTHPGEEAILAQAVAHLRTLGPEKDSARVFLVVAPRNPDRAGEVAALFNAAGFTAATLTVIEKDRPSDIQVAVIDRIGLLRDLYGICDGAIVGGSFVREGGHNPLEPASAAKPVLFGPHVDDFFLIYQELEKAGGALCINSAKTLACAMHALMTDLEKRRLMGRAGKTVFSRHQGAVRRTLEMIEHADWNAIPETRYTQKRH